VKAQMGMMEYIVLAFFIFAVITVLIFFLIGFQIGQFSVEKHGSRVDRALSLTKRVSSSQLFVKEDGVFDDGKLMSLKNIPDICRHLESFFGREWFFEVTVLDGSGTVSECTQSNYPACNYWSFCSKGMNNISFDLPVNVYRNIGTVFSETIFPRTDIGLLKVGIYVD
jgi:hypothetical protein